MPCAIFASEHRSREGSALLTVSFSDLYRAYIDCLNRRDWAQLGSYVDAEVEHNDRPLKLSGYRDIPHHDVDGPRAQYAKGLDHVRIGEPGHKEAGRASLRVGPRPPGRGLQEQPPVRR